MIEGFFRDSSIVQPPLTSAVGPEPTSRKVRYLVAVEGKADIPRTSRKDRL